MGVESPIERTGKRSKASSDDSILSATGVEVWLAG
jgi:hypothetical protein